MDGLEVSEVDVVAEDVGEEDLGEVLLPLVAVEGFGRAGEAGADMGHLGIDASELGLGRTTGTEVGNVLRQTAHGMRTGIGRIGSRRP